MNVKPYSKYRIYLLIGWITCFPLITTSAASAFEHKADYKVYFTPRDDCTTQITDALHSARKSIYMHAYSLTSQPIINALIKAHQRKVSVNIIVDRGNLAGDSKAKLLAKQGISVWVDNLSGLAHNKVIITDKEKVITGSFNFSRAAQYRNRENILIIKDKNLTNLYLQNWHRCRAKSTLLSRKISKPEHAHSSVQQSAHAKRIFVSLVACVAIGSIIALK